MKGGVLPWASHVDHLFQFYRLEAHCGDSSDKPALLDDAVDDEAQNHHDKDGEPVAGDKVQERSALLGEIAEETAAEQVCLGPDEGAGEIPQKESAVGHADLAGDGGRNCAEAGNELREQQRRRAGTVEVTLGLADAGGRLHRHAAEQLENTISVAAAQRVPHAVGDQAGGQYGNEREPGVQLVGCTQGSGGEQDRDAGDRDAQLLDQYPDKDDQVRVVDEELDRDRHNRCSSF